MTLRGTVGALTESERQRSCLIQTLQLSLSSKAERRTQRERSLQGCVAITGDWPWLFSSVSKCNSTSEKSSPSVSHTHNEGFMFIFSTGCSVDRSLFPLTINGGDAFANLC